MGAAGPSTPEDLEFEEDDGTIFVWDKTLRKYVPKELQVGWVGWVGWVGLVDWVSWWQIEAPISSKLFLTTLGVRA